MKRFFVSILCVLMALSFAACNSQIGSKKKITYKGNVDILTPNKAGGNTDLTTRLLSDWVSQNSDANLTVLNNTDGNGVVAMEIVRNADPDGKTLLLNHGSSLISMAVGVNTYCKIEEFMDEYTPICCYASGDPVLYMMIVPADSPFSTVEELVTYSKEHPGELIFGSRNATATELMGAKFVADAGIEWKFVDAGSDTDKLTQLVGGNIDVSIVNVAQVAQYYEAGKLNVLAAYSLTAEGGRASLDALKDIPSLVEMGYKNSYYNHMNFIIGPKNMDPELVKMMHELFYNAGKDSQVEQALKKAGNYVYPLDYETGYAALESYCIEIAEAIDLLKK